MPRVSIAHQDARRQQILEAATECFLRDGFHRTTMQDIQRASGLSVGAIYTYFSSKEAIIESVADERHRRETELLRAALEGGGPDSPDSRFHLAFHTLFDMLSDSDERRRRRLGIQMWAEALRNEPVRAIVQRGLDQRAVVVDAVRTAQRAGTMRDDLDPDAVSRVGLALLQGFMLQQAWEPDIDVEAYLAVVDALVDAVQPTDG